MDSFTALVTLLTQMALPVQTVHFPAPDGTMLQAALVRPVGQPHGAPVVALHGCGGPFPSRDGQWAKLLAEQGHIVLLPDSFGSRGLGSQCGVHNRTVKPNGVRRDDAIAAATYLTHMPGVPAGGVTLLGWSNGGGTTMWTSAQRPDLPVGLFRNFVAFYPGCRTVSESDGFKPSAPTMILVGESDDWTPAAPCKLLAARYPGVITLRVYPGAYHDFDAPNQPVRLRQNLATPPGGGGVAHVGTDPVAREDALQAVPAFLAAH